MISVIICQAKGKRGYRHLIMSCHVLGRGALKAAYGYCRARDAGATALRGHYAPTAKNGSFGIIIRS